MSPRCCGSGPLRLVRVGTTDVGLSGLDTVLEQIYLEGWSPGEPGLEEVLVGAARAAGNYIPHGQERAYGAALAELFRQFCSEESFREKETTRRPR